MKKSFLLTTISLLLGLSLPTTGQAQVIAAFPNEGGTYANPIINSNNADPSYMRCDDGFFYLYATGERIYRSKNLVTWTYVGKVFSDNNKPVYNKTQYYWAPCINKFGDKYVLYFAVGTMGGTGDDFYIGVATSDKPSGPFIPYDNPDTPENDKGLMFLSSQVGVQVSIDPCYFEENGHKYLFFGSYHGIYALELREDGLALKPGAEKIHIGGTAFEGTYIYKRGQYYYFFGSNGSCCSGASSTYRTVYGRSTNLLGPYYDKSGGRMLDNKFEVLIQGNDAWAGTGHNAEITEDKNGNSWIIYHAYNKKANGLGRLVLMDQVHWTSDGWPYVIGSTPSKRAAAPSF